MRKRANAVIDAWFSPNSQPVETLYRRFGVIHFVVDKKARANPQLSYFEPFKQSIAQSCRQLGGDKRWIDAPPENSIVCCGSSGGSAVGEQQVRCFV